MEYVCSGATLKCTMGTSTSKLKATPKNVTLMGQDQANIADYVSITNIPGFGKCRSLVFVCGEPALLESSTLKCVYGGTISIVEPGQNKESKK